MSAPVILKQDLFGTVTRIEREDGPRVVRDWIEGRPMQLARHAPRRGVLFRMLAHDDLRHWAKHKRHYLPERLTARQRALLARRSPLSRAWRLAVKPVYRFVTRRLLGWRDREGAGDRHLDP